MLFEGAQATLLDIDLGTYPYVTSSHPSAGGACIGTGLGPTQIDQIIAVSKSYTTRVGAGAFPTEQDNAIGDRIRERGAEYGTTTGRPRRCGWLDGVALRYSALVNGLTDLYLGHMDVLSGFDEVKIAVAYKLDGETHRGLPQRPGPPVPLPARSTRPSPAGPKTSARSRLRRPARQRPPLHRDRGGLSSASPSRWSPSGRRRDQTLFREA